MTVCVQSVLVGIVLLLENDEGRQRNVIEFVLLETVTNVMLLI